MAAQRPCLAPFQLVHRVYHHVQRPIDPSHLANLTTAISTCRSQIPIDSSYNTSTQPDLQQLCEAIGQFFFGTQALGSAWFSWDGRLFIDTGSLGVTDICGDRLTVKIEPYPDRDPVWSLGASRADSIFNIALHECVHLLFRVCAAERDCGHARCKSIFDKELGKFGHGDAFLCLASIVERHARQHGLWNVDLNLKRVAQTYVMEDERFVRRETVLVCWPEESLWHRFNDDGVLELHWYP